MTALNERALARCPFCGAPAVNVGFDYITCGSGFDCIGHQVKADPEDWNKRAPHASEPDAVAVERARDKCEMCLGAKGGEPGNENVISGVIMCDDCHALFLHATRARSQP